MSAPQLPTGTVTFLYTDIESSTKRWEQYPNVMKTAVERHDTLMREAIKAHGGIVFRTMGDAFCASFALAPQAISAALAAQQAIQAEPWNEQVAPIKVRMALHTGIGEVRDNDYVGSQLNRIARLMSTGYGGQTLLSQATYELVRDALPAGANVKDLGEHRLKDLQRPEHVFQLTAAGLPDDFPPLKTLDSHPNNLPVQRSQLVGREKELKAISGLLLRDDVALLTLTGPGGIGKTRLSLQVAADTIDHFPDGVFFVSLASIGDPGLVVSAIAQTLDVREIPSRTLIESLKDYLSDKELLLLLDNFEQVVEAAPDVSALLPASPSLKILVTSREVLRLRGEQEFRVPPLTLPDPSLYSGQALKRRPTIEALTQYEAVALFIQRARQVQPDFTVNNDNAPAVAEICWRLDGLPLAIELAAARIRLLSPQAMLPRLTSSLKFLTGGARDLPARQQTLHAAIQWSYDLLATAEQALFRRMSVFAGGGTLEAVEAVCDGETTDDGRWTIDNPSSIVHRPSSLTIDVLDGLGSLVDKSLVRQEEREGGEPYFVLLQVIREYATELLENEGMQVADEIRRSHAVHYLSLAEDAEKGFHGPQQISWLDRLEREHDNLRAALGWTIERGEVEVALRMCAALKWFWQVRGFYSQGRNWASRALSMPGAEADTPERANALLAASLMEWLHYDYPKGRDYAQESLDMWRELGLEHSVGSGLAMGFWGMNVGFLGDFELALSSMERSIELMRGIENVEASWELVYALLAYGLTANVKGDYETARTSLTEGLALYRKAGDEWGMSQALNGLGDIARIDGDYPQARKLYEESLGFYRKLDNKPDIPASLHNLGYVALAEGEVERAEALFTEALTMQIEAKNRQGIAECLAGLAGVAGARKQVERSARLFGSADAMRETLNMFMWPAERADYERNLGVARAQVDRATWDAAWAVGRAMTPEQATAYALGNE